MRHAITWPAVALVLLGGWIPLTGATAGETSGARQPAADAASANSARTAGDDLAPRRGALGIWLGLRRRRSQRRGSCSRKPGRTGGPPRRRRDRPRRRRARLRSTQELSDAVGKHRPGTAVELTIRRGSARQTLQATLTSQEAAFDGRQWASHIRAAGDQASTAANGSGTAEDRLQQHIGALQQQIFQLQQELDRVRSFQSGRRAVEQDLRRFDWGWDGRDNKGRDPDILQ